MLDEEWSPVVGYEGFYEVSTTGRVRNSSTGKIKAKTLLRGYEKVCLWKQGTVNSPLVHRLVAKAFIPNPNNKPQVNHKDGNKQNNCVSNLEWVTAKENIGHAYTSGLRNSAHSSAKVTPNDVRFIRENVDKIGKER